MKKIILIIIFIALLAIALKTIIQLFMHGLIFNPNESIAYDAGYVLGIAIKILGSVGICIFLIKRYAHNKIKIS